MTEPKLRSVGDDTGGQPPAGTRFDEWVVRHDKGSLNEGMTAAMQEVAEAVVATGKSGKVVLEVYIERIGDTGVATALSGKVTPKAPQYALPQSIAFVGEGGSLHRNDPTLLPIPGLDNKE